MARTGELIGSLGALPGTYAAWHMTSGATAARTFVLNQLHNISTSAWAQRSQDLATRHLPFTPFANHDGEAKLLKLSGSLPEQVQSLAMYLGIALNILSAYGYMRSNRASSTHNIPVLNHLRPFLEIGSSLSLAITPQILLMMIEQYKFLQTATHLGTTEAVMTFIPALLMLPAILKLPSVAEGAGYAANDFIVKPLVGAVKGVRGSMRRRKRKEELAKRKDDERAEYDQNITQPSQKWENAIKHKKIEEKRMPDISGLRPAGLQNAQQEPEAKPNLKNQYQLPEPVGMTLPEFMVTSNGYDNAPPAAT
ncbi:hypothetical protein HZC27_00275 [Candidatus Roizmanbacteria bacterium]|nr:hypothetical protein [Candidatus Roizmanbacteria bacterium]